MRKSTLMCTIAVLLICFQKLCNGIRCPYNYEQYDSKQKCIRAIEKCYKRRDGEAECEKVDGHLVTILDQDDNKFILDWQPTDDKYWIGLFNEKNGDDYWEDGSEMTPWAQFQAKELDDSSKECVFTDKGEWKEEKCNDPKFKVLCQADPLPDTEGTRHPMVTTKMTSSSPSKETSEKQPIASPLNALATSTLDSAIVVTTIRNTSTTEGESNFPDSFHVNISNKTAQKDISTNKVIMTTSSGSFEETTRKQHTANTLNALATSTLDSAVVASTMRKKLDTVRGLNVPDSLDVTTSDNTTPDDMPTNRESMRAYIETSVSGISSSGTTPVSTAKVILTQKSSPNGTDTLESDGTGKPAKPQTATLSTRSTVTSSTRPSFTVTRTTSEYRKRIEKFVPSTHEAADAVVVGTLGIVLLGSILGCIVLSDLPLYKKHFRLMLFNLGVTKQNPLSPVKLSEI